MTIYERIQEALEAMKGKQPLYDRATKLNTSVEELIQEQLIAHLGEIDNQIPEYDTHDRTHSEKVLENIEKLLRDEGIGELSFLEALTLRLCCYFHDAGMILPQCYVPLMEQVEKDPTADVADGVDVWLAGKKNYEDIKKQFYCPDSQTGFEDFLIEQLEEYQKYCKGLPEKPENILEADYFREKRHTYLRSTHGDRVKIYSQNMAAKFLTGLTGSGREDLQKAVGDICASHCWEIGEVKKLTTKLELQSACPEMTCNVRYLAMLLRLGDVLHFSSDRVNQTVYAERDPMGEVSDRHWTVKLGDLSYTISTDKKDRKIAFDGSFEDPKSYYFLQDHLNWMDEELKNYAYFVSDMHGELDSARYSLGLPTAVDRERVRAVGFKPDQDLKFKLEHQKIITLLMGLRLYRDEFMCLRELYQNALDACRCMRAENETRGLHGDLEIEFGLGTDDGGDYLYCKDQGTGMTMDIVKNYLLRIGNSYYQSAEFRRANAGWGGKVAPVSEFGIGLLSCYMIASRIEVVTRHYTKTAEDTIWISMESSDDYGYFKNPGRREKRWLGDHGTIVKIYLMDKYKPEVTDYLPENPEDAIHELNLFHQLLKRNDNIDVNDDDAVSTALGISRDVMTIISRYALSLYAQIQRFVRIPEDGIVVTIHGTDVKKLTLIDSQKPYPLSEKLFQLRKKGFGLFDILHQGTMSRSAAETIGKLYRVEENLRDATVMSWLKLFSVYPCKITHDVEKAEAYTVLHLPVTADIDVPLDFCGIVDLTLGANLGWRKRLVYIDGMGIEFDFDELFGGEKTQLEGGEITYNYFGSVRPSLTVDRGDIQTISDEVLKLERSLHGMLLDEVVYQIEEHFKIYRTAVSKKVLAYLECYLRRKFGFRSYNYIMKALSHSLFREYQVCDIALQCLYETEEIRIADPEQQLNKIMGPILAVLGEAKHIAVNGLCVTASQNLKSYDEWDTLGKEYEQQSMIILVDDWNGIYQQYDLVTSLWPLAPLRLQGKLYEWIEVPKTRKYYKHSYMLSIDHLLTMTTARPSMTFGEEGISDVILQITEQPDKRILHTCSISIFKRENIKEYVLYVFVAPSMLTEEDKKYVSRYNHIPQYREGVEKGWSILFYNYKQGYVIAPGIVDRMEMLKLLPQEALDHDDGLEYYFTDGTFAF